MEKRLVYGKNGWADSSSIKCGHNGQIKHERLVIYENTRKHKKHSMFGASKMYK